MNRQEYHEKLLCIKTDNVGLKLMEGIKIRNQYIDSLESENEQLAQDNLDLMKQVEEVGLKHEKLIERACDYFATNDFCIRQLAPCNSPFITCEQCWREWLENGE